MCLVLRVVVDGFGRLNADEADPPEFLQLILHASPYYHIWCS